MLGRGHERQLIADLWEFTEAKVILPYSQADADSHARGSSTTRYDDQRAYPRFYMHGDKAILKRSNSLLGAFTKDVSRQGIGFYSPVQLMPKEFVQLMLASAEVKLQVSRCQRICKDCFDCGGTFSL